MFAGRRTKAGRTWGSEAGQRDWMTVEEMWERHPERFHDRGVGADEPDASGVPVLAAY